MMARTDSPAKIGAEAANEVPLPAPRKILIPPVLLAAAKSCFPSALKSPVASETGLRNCPVEKLVGLRKPALFSAPCLNPKFWFVATSPGLTTNDRTADAGTVGFHPDCWTARTWYE